MKPVSDPVNKTIHLLSWSLCQRGLSVCVPQCFVMAINFTYQPPSVAFVNNLFSASPSSPPDMAGGDLLPAAAVNKAESRNVHKLLYPGSNELCDS